jgi:hypothetical protein
MSAKVILAMMSIVLLVGCTTAAAPAPGERAMQMFCKEGTLKVCTGYTGSRIKAELPSCSCS